MVPWIRCPLFLVISMVASVHSNCDLAFQRFQNMYVGLGVELKFDKETGVISSVPGILGVFPEEKILTAMCETLPEFLSRSLEIITQCSSDLSRELLPSDQAIVAMFRGMCHNNEVFLAGSECVGIVNTTFMQNDCYPDLSDEETDFFLGRIANEEWTDVCSYYVDQAKCTTSYVEASGCGDELNIVVNELTLLALPTSCMEEMNTTSVWMDYFTAPLETTVHIRQTDTTTTIAPTYTDNGGESVHESMALLSLLLTLHYLTQ